MLVARCLPRVGLARLVVSLGVVSLCAAAGPARAQSPDDPRAAKPERPSVATHAFTVAPGILEVEAGIQAQHPTPGSSIFAVPVLLKIGLTRRLQLDVSPGWVRLGLDGKAVSGPTDLAVGLKWHVADAVPVLGATAVQASTKFATGSVARDIGTGTTDLNLIAISSHSFGGVSLDVNAGYAHRSGEGMKLPADWTMWACSAGIPVTGAIGWAAEVFGYPGTSGSFGTPPIVGLLLGPTWTPQRSIVLDAGIIVSLEHMGGTAVYTGLTWNVGHVWTPRSGRPGGVSGVVGPEKRTMQ